MGTNTLSGVNTIGITLTSGGAYLSPFTAGLAGTVETGAGTNGVYSSLTNPSLLNEGLINAGFDGVAFTDGGSVANSGAGASISGVNTAIFISSGYGLVLNEGVLNGGSFDGVYLGAGGSVANAAGGAIYGYNTGIDARNSTVNVTNFGTISGRNFDGVYLGAGGSLANSGLSATISGFTGVRIGDYFVNVTNTGVIAGTGNYGLNLAGGGYVGNTGPSAEITGFTGIYMGAGSVVNAGTIAGSGGDGVTLTGSGTIVNAGTISGNQTAVAFGVFGSNRLIVDPGAVFSGAVYDGPNGQSNALDNVLELGAGAGAGQSTLAGIGTSFTGFNTVAFDGGANWLVSGDVAGLNGDAISGFAVVDTLDVTDLDFAGPSMVTADSNGVIAILESGGGTFGLTFSSAYDDDVFTLASDGGGGTDITEFPAYDYSNVYGLHQLGLITLTGINDAGEAVGYYDVSTNGEGLVNEAFLYSDGTFTSFGPSIVGTYSVSGYYPAAINGSGEVAGYLIDGPRFAFTYEDGTLTTFVVPATLASSDSDYEVAYATGINDTGVVSGYFSPSIYTTETEQTPFIYDNGTVTVLPNPAGEQTDLNTTGMNDSNEITGWFFDGDTGTADGFIYNNGTYTTLSGTGADEWIQPMAINNSGEVAGYAFDAGSFYTTAEGFIYNDGSFTTLTGPPGASDVIPVAINDSGEVAGYYYYGDATDQTKYGFVYQNGTYTTIFDPSGAATGTNLVDDSVLGLNDAGDVVGYYATAGTEYAFIAEPACFAVGTRLRAALGNIAIEDLKIGDRLKTQHSGLQTIKWIGRRDYDGRFIAGNKDMLPVCIKRHAIAPNIPARDLWVSPGHAICIDGALIHAFRLINGVSIIQAGNVESVSYYHIEMAKHEIIFAESCPAETFMDERFRRQFQNADEYRLRYPGQAAPNAPCLPRLEGGFALQDIRRRLNTRAGIAGDARPPGRLRGFVDIAGPKICAGWAQDEDNPEEPVCLDIFVDGAPIARVLANHFRADLRDAGLGSGCHAFGYTLPSGGIGWLDIRRATDGADLAWTAAAAAEAA